MTLRAHKADHALWLRRKTHGGRALYRAGVVVQVRGHVGPAVIMQVSRLSASAGTGTVYRLLHTAATLSLVQGLSWVTSCFTLGYQTKPLFGQHTQHNTLVQTHNKGGRERMAVYVQCGVSRQRPGACAGQAEYALPVSGALHSHSRSQQIYTALTRHSPRPWATSHNL